MQQEWHAKGADCCSPFTGFLMAWCFPCVVYGRVHHRLHKDPHLQGHSAFNADCCGWYALACCGCSWILSMMQRGEIEKKYSLGGGSCKACMCACFCPACDLIQQDKETEFREGEMATLVSVQPGKMDGMHYGA